MRAPPAQKEERGGKDRIQLLRIVPLDAGVALEVRHLRDAPDIDRDHIEVRTGVLGDILKAEVHLQEFLAIGAPALAEIDDKPLLARRDRLLEVDPQVEEALLEPGGMVHRLGQGCVVEAVDLLIPRQALRAPPRGRREQYDQEQGCHRTGKAHHRGPPQRLELTRARRACCCSRRATRARPMRTPAGRRRLSYPPASRAAQVALEQEQRGHAAGLVKIIPLQQGIDLGQRPGDDL